MGLDIHLEADKRMSLVHLADAVNAVGVAELEQNEHSVVAHFHSGLFLSGCYEVDDPDIRAQGPSDLAFPVAVRGYLRIKGPAPEDADPLADVRHLVEQLTARCEACFLISFQYESLMYCRDEEGLHVM
ncbi:MULTISPECIES: hypothetical protein [unclassified Pseudomonas]|jgi:hypothetical protein|uniref:hypothetical protein n=1 Tax=unclassified Pseudomonas TaxID=196821 RepID=UPI000812696C|nr:MULTISPECIES: hypothetical protein [unclassified Pseudomonas]MDT9633105.1 hypothetical protein [Pseudomonas sp. JV449]TKJ79123.1 hypothetical protein PspCFBP13509_14260 [Pseudomonas sp. CFBP13509]CRM07079.1 hypothetical protein [Pseudomonas sp. 8 R 14]